MFRPLGIRLLSKLEKESAILGGHSSSPNEYVYSWQARHDNIMNTLASFVREFSNNAVAVRMIQESASTSLRLAVTHAFFLGHYPGRMKLTQ